MKGDHGRSIQREKFGRSAELNTSEIRTANFIRDRLQWEAYGHHYFQRFALNINIEDYLSNQVKTLEIIRRDGASPPSRITSSIPRGNCRHRKAQPRAVPRVCGPHSTGRTRTLRAESSSIMSRVIYDGVPVPDEPKASVSAAAFLAQAKAQRNNHEGVETGNEVNQLCVKVDWPE